MKTRKVLAAAALAALPLFTGTMHAGPDRAAADAPRHANAAERSGGPRALYWAGVDGGTAVGARLALAYSPGLAWAVAL